jgi:hypothetical protein
LAGTWFFFCCSTCISPPRRRTIVGFNLEESFVAIRWLGRRILRERSSHDVKQSLEAMIGDDS